MTIIGPIYKGTIAPQQADRRLIKRFGDAWAAAARGRLPSWRELRAVDLGRDWNWVFVVDLAQSNGYPHFDFLGPQLARYAEFYLAGGGEWAVSVLDRAADGINSAVIEEGPQINESSLVLEDGRTLIFRSLTAPLSEDGQTITHVVGCASGRLGDFEDGMYQAVNDEA